MGLARALDTAARRHVGSVARAHRGAHPVLLAARPRRVDRAAREGEGRGQLGGGGPAPENIGLHRLCEDTVLMTDTCNGARCTRRMVAAAAMVAVEAKVGKAAWEAMTEEERERKYKTYLGDCWQ